MRACGAPVSRRFAPAPTFPPPAASLSSGTRRDTACRTSPANGPAAYWPGGGYVDIVADDMFSDSGEPSWRGMDTLYGYGKPFLVGDWGLEGEDDVAFAARMFDWVAKHPRTIGLVYFDKGWSGGTGIYQLHTKPQSLALYRRAIAAARFVTTLP